MTGAPSTQARYIADALRAAAALLRPGLTYGEDGWWCCNTVLMEVCREPDAGMPGLWYSAFGDFDMWLTQAVPVGAWMQPGTCAHERQVLRFMWLDLLAYMAESDE